MRIYLRIYKLFTILTILLINTSCKAQTDNAGNNYAVAIFSTPVLNTSDFESVFGGNSGTEVKLDSKGLIREMEFIAFPNTLFEILEIIPKVGYDIYKIKTNDYQYNSADLFIDSRFVRLSDSASYDREISMPSKEEILKNMNALEGYQYMWGGNRGDGISQLLDFYKPKAELQSSTENLWMLKGVDCSGLVYESTGGATPRNTSSLINYGEAVEISGMNAMQISEILRPLDLICWSGHVIIVIEGNMVIESTPEYGVHKSDLYSRLKSVMKERTPVNDWGSTSGKRFVVRRWI